MKVGQVKHVRGGVSGGEKMEKCFQTNPMILSGTLIAVAVIALIDNHQSKQLISFQ